MTIIHVENVSKRYLINDRPNYSTLRDALTAAAKGPFHRLARRRDAARSHDDSTLWALRDISFDVQQGEVVGVIGRNGAGKSTLLKVLSRITRPTAGSVVLRGTTASLLEVGTGFHPELSGRDNVYLSGAVLGMSKAEIDRKFSDIVDFSGIGRFLDTPIKHYSSGMQVRLGFAVAAHLDPQVLIIDEVLAVGDAEFQRKCLGRMEEVSAEGRTILFVSHNMPAVTRLCPRVLLLDHGRVVADGTSHEVVRAYLDTGTGSTASRSWPDADTAPGDGIVRLKTVRVVSGGATADTVDIRRPVDVEVEYLFMGEHTDRRPCVWLFFRNEDGIDLFGTSEFSFDAWKRRRHDGVVLARCHIPGNFFAEGLVFVTVIVASVEPRTAHAVQHDAVAFHVVDTQEGGSVRGRDATRDWPGVVRPLFEWSFEEDPARVHRA